MTELGLHPVSIVLLQPWLQELTHGRLARPPAAGPVTMGTGEVVAGSNSPPAVCLDAGAGGLHLPDKDREKWYYHHPIEFLLRMGGDTPQFKSWANACAERDTYLAQHPDESVWMLLLSVAPHLASWERFAAEYSGGGSRPEFVDMLLAPVHLPPRVRREFLGFDVADSRGDSVLWSRSGEVEGAAEAAAKMPCGLLARLDEAESLAAAANPKLPVPTVWAIDFLATGE